MNHHLDFKLYYLKEGVDMKMSCFTPNKEPLTNQINLENEWNACVIN